MIDKKEEAERMVDLFASEARLVGDGYPDADLYRELRGKLIAALSEHRGPGYIRYTDDDKIVVDVAAIVRDTGGNINGVSGRKGVR